MRSRQGEEFETYHLTCPVCSALPGTSCIDEDYHELVRVHPSRRVSIAERNRRHADGWVPPELAEGYARDHEARVARAPLFDSRLGAGVTAALQGRRPRATVEPQRGRWSAARATGQAPARAGDADVSAGGDTAAAGRNAAGLAVEEGGSNWLAAYLSHFPAGASVRREVLRDLAAGKSRGVDSRIPVSQAKRIRRLIEGHSSGASNGRRSSQRLSANLKDLEGLGLIKRETTRDTVVIIDPGGLRELGGSPRLPDPGPAVR